MFLDGIALDMIARSDAAGLARAIKSARPHVDLVSVGVDMRSDEETHVVAKALADDYWTFDAAAIGLRAVEWRADQIHFANARNLGRQRVTQPWVLVVDTDEFLEAVPGALRAAVRAAPETCDSIPLSVQTDMVAHGDPQRLARVEARWSSGTHNQLGIETPGDPAVGVRIVQDMALRSQGEQRRRDAQREVAMVGLQEAAEEGDVSAMWHVAKHAAHHENAELAVEWALKFRAATEVCGPLAVDRAHLAFLIGCLFFKQRAHVQAEQWAVRSLLDGPTIEPLCLLGDIAELRGDRAAALIWYEVACVTEPAPRLFVRETLQMRFERRAELRA